MSELAHSRYCIRLRTVEYTVSLRLAWATSVLVSKSSLRPRAAKRRVPPRRARLRSHTDQSRRGAGHYLIAKHSHWLWVREAAKSSQRLRRLLGALPAASGVRREMWAPLPHLKKEPYVGERQEPAPCPHCPKFCMETL